MRVRATATSIVVLLIIIVVIVFVGIYALFYMQYLTNPLININTYQEVPPFIWPPWTSPYWHALFG